MHTRFVFILLVTAACLMQCTPPEMSDKAQKTGSVNLDLRNKQVQQVFRLRDERKIDSLRGYLSNPNATLRYLAALSFASIRDSNSVAALTPLMRDNVEDVRIAAAFSIGQTAWSKAELPLTQAFVAGDSTSAHQRFNAVVLEAIGKCGGLPSLKNIAAVTTYLPSDTLLLEGQCRAIYRFGLRGITDLAGTSRMVGYVANEKIPEPARLMAANYLARAKDVAPDSTQAFQIAAGFVRASSNSDIRMSLAKALGRSKTKPAFGMLSKVITSEKDWRVRCNIINAMAKFEYDTVLALVMPLINDPNPHISLTAASFFIANGQPQDGEYYYREARDNTSKIPVLSQIALYHASNKWLAGRNYPETKDAVVYRLKDIFQQAKDPYQRAACITALGESGWQYRWIHDKGLTDSHPAVKSAAAEALVGIIKRDNFWGYFGEGAKGVRREIYFYLREIVDSEDPGMIAASAEGFMTPAMTYKSFRDSTRTEDFQDALEKLKMPRDYEAYTALTKVMAWFDGRPEPAKPKVQFNHPINWDRLKVVAPKTEVTITTNKGVIVVELYPQWAPGSVANFLELAGTGFYNGKSFHRVVLNFVIQGGCPRGDGYGALDYSIRSEIGLTWFNTGGYLGMASAGPDTEGTQFFITHSPAPHLDGNYTIFGKVKRGMEVVEQIGPGDVMNKVEVQY
jgi:cyclophilin family peptidyl-prolyl cis-trans isomerase/HEAT repeat protein